MELFKDLKSGAAWAGNLGWWSPWLKFPNCTAGAVDPPGGGRGGGCWWPRPFLLGPTERFLV